MLDPLDRLFEDFKFRVANPGMQMRKPRTRAENNVQSTPVAGPASATRPVGLRPTAKINPAKTPVHGLQTGLKHGRQQIPRRLNRNVRNIPRSSNMSGSGA